MEKLKSCEGTAHSMARKLIKNTIFFIKDCKQYKKLKKIRVKRW